MSSDGVLLAPRHASSAKDSMEVNAGGYLCLP